MRLVGIDPGFKGGLAIFDDEKVIFCCPMPIVTVKVGKKDRNKIDGITITKLLKEYNVSQIIIEQVHAFPGQGGVGNFSFGQNFGTLLGIFEALGIPYTEISPMKWKKFIFGKDREEGKNQGIEFCNTNYGYINLLPTKRSKKLHDGMSDAICIGHSFRFLDNEK
jgi:Holliday junction resolvasome RuvABC endonuclease subunit